MACDPPSCLEIPPALPPSSPLCGWELTWYRIWPITFPLGGIGLGTSELQQALTNIANAGGRVLSANLFFRDSKGGCTLEVTVLYPNPGAPGLINQQVTCPPGYRWDSLNEQCVLDIPIPIPIPLPGPGPGPGPGPEPGPGPAVPPGCRPNCTNTSTGRVGNLSLPCMFLCDVAEVGEQECINSCCVPCDVVDPPVPRGTLELSSGERRSLLPSHIPFEVRDWAVRLSAASTSASLGDKARPRTARFEWLSMMKPRTGTPIAGAG